MTTKRTIKVKKYSDNIIELVASAAITPGMVVEQMSTDFIRAHSTEDGNCLPMIALEDELQGKIISEAYAQNDPVQVWIPARGDEFYGILASGESVAKAAFLVSNGDGKLKALPVLASTGDVFTTQIIGVATEAINAALADARIIVRVI